MASQFERFLLCMLYAEWEWQEEEAWGQLPVTIRC